MKPQREDRRQRHTLPNYSSLAWKVSLFEYSKLPLRKSLTALPPSTISQPAVSTSYRTA